MSKLTKEVTINAPKEKVWEVLADFGGVARWAPTINHAVTTSEASSGVGCERECDVAGFGKVKERIVEWEEGNYYTYEIDGVGPMKYVRTTWSVTAVGGGSVVTLSINVRMKFGPLGALLVPVARIAMRKQARLSLAGLKYHVETGETVGDALPKGVIAAA